MCQCRPQAASNFWSVAMPYHPIPGSAAWTKLLKASAASNDMQNGQLLPASRHLSALELYYCVYKRVRPIKINKIYLSWFNMDSLSSILRPSMYGLVWIHVEIKWLMLVILFKFRYPMSPQKKTTWPQCFLESLLLAWADLDAFGHVVYSTKLRTPQNKKKTDLRLCAWLIWMVEACLRLNYRHL